MFRLLLGLVLALSVAPTFAAVKGEEVAYESGGVVMKGYLAYDDAIKSKRPGVLVVHDWWGHGEYVRGRARALAALGYTALAVDMYGSGKQVEHPDDAGKLSGTVRGNLPVMKARFNAARDVLGKHGTVDARRIAAIGYSYGGSTVLEMARQGVDIAGVVNFYGDLTTQHPAPKGGIKANILVLNAAADAMIPPEQVNKFKQEMAAVKADYKFINYPGTKHLFTRPDADALAKKYNLSLAYDAEADRKSWTEMQAFFKRIFR
ncbi:MAG TPA: dienelactone hydrolase family protein [Burkholderiales bacterium]|nr:dienelactone hydrolase family protein [Burkholderiales bacterium]